MLFGSNAELAQVSFSAAVDRIDRGAQVICVLSVALATGEYASLRKRFERGEGIDKPTTPDFASEVAKMAGG